MSPAVEVVRTVLELRSPEQLRAARSDDPLVRFARQESPNIERYRRLYRAVGHRWYWRDRDAWTDAQLAAHLASPTVVVWECLVADEPAGFFELVRHPDETVEIAYFGLTDRHIGRGLGKAMLTRAATEAWALGPTRVWLHTCTLDSPHALPNYIGRGFTEVRQESYIADLPDDD